MSMPRADGARSGGRCPLHRDYDCEVETPGTRSISYYLLLQKVEEKDGPTVVYPFTRSVAARPRHTPIEKKKAGRPCERATRARARTTPGPSAGPSTHKQINPHDLARDLGRRAGDPVMFTGPAGTLFRHESGDWHGALANNGEQPRAVLLWTYSTPELASDRYQLEVV